jgi:hypothetical protein
MPQVPLYDNPQTQRAALRGGEMNVQADPAALGATQGRQLQQLGQGLGDLAVAGLRIQEQRDLEESFRQVSTIRGDFEKFKEELVKTRQGVNAKGVKEDVDAWWAKAEETYGSKMSPRVKALAARSMITSRAEAVRGMSAFEMQQLDAAGADAYKANLSTISKDAANGDEQSLRSKMGEGLAAIEVYGRTKGWDPKTLANEKENFQAGLHVDRINRLMIDPSKGPTEAKLYYESLGVRDVIPERTRLQLEERLKSGIAGQVGGTGARDVFNATMGGKSYHDAVPQDQMDKELVKRFGNEPATLAAARQELDRQVALFNKAQVENDAANLDKTYGLLQANKPLSAIKASAPYQAMSNKAKQSFDVAYENRQELLRARDARERDRVEKKQEDQFAAATVAYTDPDVLAKMTAAEVVALRPVIGEKNFAKLYKNWDTYQKDQAKLGEARVDNELFGDILTSRGVNPKPGHLDKEGAATVMRLRNEFERQIGAKQRELRRELTRTEKEEVMTTLANAQVLTPGTFGSKATIEALVPPAELKKASVQVQTLDAQGKPSTVTVPLASIPDQDYAKLAARLKADGVQPTAQAVGQAWHEYQQWRAKQKQNRYDENVRSIPR